MKKIIYNIISLFLIINWGITESTAKNVEIYYNHNSEQIKFAVGDLIDALHNAKSDVKTFALSSINSESIGKDSKIFIATKEMLNHTPFEKIWKENLTELNGIGEQSFSIKTDNSSGIINYYVVGGDETGTMYGVLELAENISNGGWGKIYDIQQSPYIRYRGMKLNMPLDRRIPTYVGGWSSNSTKHAIPNVWDMKFWKKLIDTQARARYNMISVWVHHPFPALVKVNDYPKACLPNIEGFDGYVNNLTYEDRVNFWREIMRYAHNRGMKFYFFNWNIYVDYAESQYKEITRKQNNPVTVDYTYKCMMALLDTYPELDGFGISGGDGMASYTDVKGNSEWTYSVYGRAVHDYFKKHPNRKFNLIHRRLGTNPDLWNDIYSPLDSCENVNREFSSKYSQAHMYSTTSPQWSVNDIKRLSELGRKTWLTIRNDDFFYFDWGDHGFVRDYIKNIPYKETISGIYIGSDGYTPTRAYLYKDSDFKNLLDVERRWYMETLWGRISYNPDLDNSVLIGLIQNKYPTINAKKLFEAWTLASRSLPKVTELIVNDWDLDFEWYPEACSSDPGRCTGFRTIDDFVNLASPAKGSKFSSILESAKGEKKGKISSLVLADEMYLDAKKSLEILDTIDYVKDKDTRFKIANVSQMAYLSLYYSHKIKGATLKVMGNLDLARNEMKKAYDSWLKYIGLMEEYYIPDSFRNIEIAPDWHFADKVVLQEYLDLGGDIL